MSDKTQNSFQELADTVASDSDADVLLFAGPITRDSAKDVSNQCSGRKRRKNIFIILETYGGSADAGYQIARCFQHKYDKFILLVRGMCKSSGTLIALGSNEIVMCDTAELGPLDVQMSKKDELWESQSGHIVNTAIDYLQNRAFNSFQDFFRKIALGEFGNISLKTAAGIAGELTKGLYSPIFAQIDPMHAGEAGRATLIAYHYGSRLIRKSEICSEDKLWQLIYNYPSHGFVIDINEAIELFSKGKVRVPTQKEIDLLGTIPLNLDLSKNIIVYLSSEHKENTIESHEGVPTNGDTGENTNLNCGETE